MKIGIVTFHTSVNYGAVLQTYSLQNTLSSMGHDVWVIDFDVSNKKRYPGRFEKIPIVSIFAELRRKRKYFSRRKALISDFNHLRLTEKYETVEQLNEKLLDFEAFVAGSDQIWNPNFIHSKSHNLIPAYFLDFGKESVKRISYSASIGQSEIPEWFAREIIHRLKAFSKISVREESGKYLLESLGVSDIETVCDPTILQSARFFEELVTKDEKPEEPTVFQFTIRQQTGLIAKYMSGRRLVMLDLRKQMPITIGEWLGFIRDASFVITDSFHCVIMCLKFHTPFLVVQVRDGKLDGMNTRLEYLLGRLGLSEILVDANDDNSVKHGTEYDIDWNDIDLKLLSWANSSLAWLERATGDNEK
jgi:hypothetical protein